MPRNKNIKILSGQPMRSDFHKERTYEIYIGNNHHAFISIWCIYCNGLVLEQRNFFNIWLKEEV